MFCWFTNSREKYGNLLVEHEKDAGMQQTDKDDTRISSLLFLQQHAENITISRAHDHYDALQIQFFLLNQNPSVGKGRGQPVDGDGAEKIALDDDGFYSSLSHIQLDQQVSTFFLFLIPLPSSSQSVVVKSPRLNSPDPHNI